MAAVTLKNVVKRYGDQTVIHGIDLAIADGEFTVFVGPSGCGKSTLLRMIAGLEDISAGELQFDGRRANELAPAARELAMVFQSYALYPHMTVYENMAFALQLARQDKAKIRTAVERVADVLQITHLLARRPKDLSGGQRQRVAIGRAIVREPKLFLFDEPLSNLDASLRVQMRVELSRLHQQLGTTMIYVTHDQVEAMTLGQRIVVFNQGRIEQAGTPRELYDAPANLFVAGFLGSPKMNLIPAADAGVTGAVTVGIRPEHVRLAMSDDAQRTAATVTHVEYLGDQTIVYASVGATPVAVKLPPQGAPLAPGERIDLHLPRAQCHLFDADGRRQREA
ncbi:multiple sugar transport system ATP-binding protein [Pseudoduganella lurida]|uniref:Multiple sugar transport system ATP-binding protein n=1 Tax=Pseudoduganella lurida TaxID=1036180 RepID=A0A562RA87_9BURK|nr:sn-glycerol-3-phosphate ABC transporter ATP-binding protein UgpC [Pseudoduganella lurida]TWI65320.1 multiple sugar transport system ATP-binding protein [Pseudoduganella lurida]